MSLKPDPIGLIPAGTARVAKAACPKGSTCIRMRDELSGLFHDEMFPNLFPKDRQHYPESRAIADVRQAIGSQPVQPSSDLARRQ